jgi:4-hydroxybenzoate polyprenyltransferase
MAFNRLADRFIDGENPRTAGRHLPAGQLSVTSVVVFTILSTLLFFGGLCLFLPNYLPLAVSPIVLVVLFGYSYTKRFTSLAHFWLGVALMLAPVCAWLAIRGLIVATDVTDLVPSVILGVGILFWVAGFDIIYACQDYEYDRQKKLNSVPVRLGIVGALRLAAVCHAVAVLAFLALPLLDGYVGPELGLGWLFLLAGLAVAGLLIYEHSIVSARDLTRVNVAFFNVNAVISIGLLAVGLLDLFVV